MTKMVKQVQYRRKKNELHTMLSSIVQLVLQSKPINLKNIHNFEIKLNKIQDPRLHTCLLMD